MGDGLLALAEALMTSSERRLELTSRNISNISTPGYKRLYPFDQILSDAAQSSAPRIASDQRQGGLTQTGSPFDLAIVGDGLFQLRSDEGVYFTRNGQFERRADGHVVNAQGFALQTASGDDLIVSGSNVEITQNGTVLDDGAPVARIGLYAAQDWSALSIVGGSLFQAPPDQIQELDQGMMRQGMLETANTELAQEMLDMMQTLRAAETGARLAQTYDTLIGQSITTLGRTQ
jgi:flagellar basal-body rod protein FlgG